MKHLAAFIFVFALLICASLAVPLDDKDTNKDAKSVFGPAFDEIVVESHLTVRRKSNTRQGRTQNVTNEASKGIIKAKREIKLPTKNLEIEKKNNMRPNPIGFGISEANSQSQAFNSFGPLGSFGASASGSQTQMSGLGPNGLKFSAGFSGTQQYNFNGQTVNIAFGSGASGSGRRTGVPFFSVTNTDGKKLRSGG